MAAKKLYSGQSSAPFLALVGVSLASGTGLITKEDEVECVCSEIRQAAAKIQASSKTTEPEISSSPSLSDFELGTFLAKGCNAVVCAARYAKDRWSEVSKAFEHIEGRCQEPDKKNDEYPLAIKMMFNYEAESNASAIMTAMHKEILPLKDPLAFKELQDLSVPVKTLPAHPNVVKMHTAFADSVPSIPDAITLFPDALPRRLNPEGSGRNMSLFLVMKRYDCSLKQFLAERSSGQLSWRTSLVILTQILEAVTHLVDCEVSHRDLKTDNILLDLSGRGDAATFPWVTITDFGCSFTGPRLRLHFTSPHVDRGGNVALMAPEVLRAAPGTFTFIDYGKADVWAVGAIAYEVFGGENPFYRRRRRHDNSLPSLPDHVPPILTALVAGMLQESPRSRLSAEMAANVCQLLLWAPSAWLVPQKNGDNSISTQDLLQWLLTMTTKVMCESTFRNSGKALHEYQMVTTFLRRLSLPRVKEAIIWIRNNQV